MPVSAPLDDLPSGGMSLSQRMAALRTDGEEGWRSRIEEKRMSANDVAVVFRKTHEDAVTSTPVLGADESKENNGDVGTPQNTSGDQQPTRPRTIADRLSLLTQSGQTWRRRVPDDRDRRPLTVVGKLERAGILPPPPAPPAAAALSLPARRPSHPTVTVTHERDDSGSKPLSDVHTPRRRPVSTIVVSKDYDEGFNEFFTSSDQEHRPLSVIVDVESLDAVKSEQPNLAFSKDVRRPPKRKQPSSNPIKFLAGQNDIVRDEYDEKTPFRLPAASRKNNETTRVRPVSAYVVGLDPHAISGNRGSQLADEALRALSAKEDFSAVRLRRADEKTPSNVLQYPPYKDTMLIQVRGRKHVDMRLVKPDISSMHSAASFVLVGPDDVMVFDGQFANVLERAKAREAAAYIVDSHDLGSRKAESVTEVDAARESSRERFLRVLDPASTETTAVFERITAPDDMYLEERYECRVAHESSTMYQLEGDELVKCEELCNKMLSFNSLCPNKVFVFDFGAEVYTWSGRGATTETRKAVVDVARRRFPYDDWRLFGEVKDRMETVLFRAKFENWPDDEALKSVQISKPITGPSTPSAAAIVNGLTKKQILAFKDPDSVAVSAEELGKSLASRKRPEPDLVLEDQSVERGREVFNPFCPTLSKYEVVTENVAQWRCVGPEENAEVEEVQGDAFGHFSSACCYIVRWRYRVSVAGRHDLSGKVAAARETGRSRSAFFYWIGAETNRSQQGLCALSVKRLDTERSPHVRVTQGLEPPAFLNLFRGAMIVHEPQRRVGGTNRMRIYAAMGGPFLEEFAWVETDPCPERALRSQSAYLLVDGAGDDITAITLWYGALCSARIRVNATAAAALFDRRRRLTVSHCEDGTEPPSLRSRFGGRATAPWTFARPLDCSPTAGGIRVFRFLTQSSNQEYGLSESVGACYSGLPEAADGVAFPFEQDDLYAAEQPAVFLVEQGDGARLWLWQGWIEGDDEDNDDDVDGSVTKPVDEAALQKLRMLRLFALKTAAVHWRARGGDVDKAKLVYAGLEPEAFQALFPLWTKQPAAALANRQAGHEDGETSCIFAQLASVSRSEYAAERLRRRPLPDGIDSSRLEHYLSDEEFTALFRLPKALFYEQPAWKRIQLKKDADLF